MHNEDQPFWLDLARQQRGPILELGCGTGRLLAHLAEAGCQVYGLDRDYSMLAYCHALRRSNRQALLPVFQADMADYRLAQRFALIHVPCNTFSTLPEATRQKTLQRARSHLLPAGLFAASLPNPVIMARLPLRSDAEIDDSFNDPVSGDPVQVSSAWVRSAKVLTIRWNYDHLFPDGRVERSIIEVRHWIGSVESYRAEIISAGFQIVAEYGDYDRSSYTQESPYWIALASISTQTFQ
jgi:SAM-dependent methyltransferase